MSEIDSDPRTRRGVAILPLCVLALSATVCGSAESVQENALEAVAQQSSGVHVDASAPGTGSVVDRASLADGIVAENDVADREALDTYPYLATCPLEVDLELANGESLVAYRWDDGKRIPATRGSKRVRVPFGELGSGPLTTLYAPFNVDEKPLQKGFEVVPTDVSIADGRKGGALHMEGRKSGLHITSSDRPILADSWTIELWWLAPKEHSGDAATVLDAPGFFRLWIEKAGRLFVEFVGEQNYKSRPDATVRWGEWNHIALIVDQELRSVRVALNDSLKTRLLEDEHLAGSTKELYLGRSTRGWSITGLVDELRIERAAADSAEMIDNYFLEAAPGEHVLHAELSSGSRDIPVWAGIHTTPELRGRDAWATGELEFFNASDDGLKWMPAYWTRDFPDNPPLGRTTQPVVFVGNHEAFMFSGETKDSHLRGMSNTRDTWIYHIDEERWERVDGPGPEGRCHQSAAYSPDHDVVLYPGGWINPNRGEHAVLADTWLFHVKERRWEERKPGGDELDQFKDDGVIYNTKDKKFYVFQWHKIMCYDVDANTWTRVRKRKTLNADGTPDQDVFIPGSPICEYDPDTNTALLFAGVDYRKEIGEGRYFNRTSIYDFETNTMHHVDVDHAPSKRTRGAMAYDSKRKRFVMFGGVQHQFSDRMRDLWTFDMRTKKWTEVEDAMPPSRRGGFYKMAYDPELDVFSMLCGRASPKRFLNEAWRLRMNDAAEARATYVFDRAGFPDLDRLVADVSDDARERVRFELASSPNSIVWSTGDAFDPSARFVKVTLLASAGESSARVEGLRFASASELSDSSGLVAELARLR